MPQRATFIRIPQLCSERWAAMTPTALGHHCAACAKTVVDFTEKSDAEILSYFEQQGRGRTCGRFRPEQLSRPLATALPIASAPRWQLWLASLLAAALAMQSCQPTTREPFLTTQSPPQAADSVSALPPPAIDTTATLICGNVVDVVSQLPVMGATITLRNSSLHAITNAAGYFMLPENAQIDLGQPLTLEIGAVGYPTRTQAVFPTPAPPASGLLAILTTFPLPTIVLGEVEALHR